MTELTRKQQALIKSLYTRHGRKKSGLCVCEGIRSCGELYAARPDLVEFSICAPEAADKLEIPGTVYRLPRAEVDALGATVNGQGILAVARTPEAPPETAVPPDAFLLALDRIGDPGNFGTICRTARAAGLTELWYTAGSVDPYSDKVIRSALGAQFSMKLRQFRTLEELREAAVRFGYGPVCISTPHGGENCFTAPGLYDRTVMVIGSEGDGAAPLAGARPVVIPMPGNFESLNAAQAATILIFEYVRRISPQR